MPAHSWNSVTKRVSLAELGQGWEDCYVNVSELSYLERSAFIDKRNDVLKGEEVKDSELATYVLALVKKHFIGGQMLVNGNVEDMTVDDLSDAPGQVINLLLDGTLGVVPDPKDSPTTTETSPTPSDTTEQPSN